MRRYEIGKGTVLGILRDASVQMRAQGIDARDLDQAAALYEAGLSLREVAARFSCDAETIRTAFRVAGIPVRKPWERVKRTDTSA